jgi:NodT family efflux transporter outer membrane factor (OMF) lipoprotein
MWSRIAGLSAAASVLALAGCASLPPASPPRTAKVAQAYAAGQSFAAPQASWPADGWWRAYGDPQLSVLIDEALAGSPDVAQADARVRKAQAIAGQVRAAGLPQAAVNGRVESLKQSYNLGIPPEFVPQGYNDYGRLALDFSWELDFWGKNRAAVAAATSEAAAAQAEAAQARLMLSAATADAYADLARLYAEHDVAERALALREETAALVQKRVTNGLDTQGELRQAQAGPPAARAEMAAVDEEIALTRNRIAALMGEGPDRGLSIARPQAAKLKPFGLPPNLTVDLLGRRPDVVAARWRAEAAQRRISEAKAAFYPNINLTAFVGAQSLGLDQLFKSGSDIGDVGPAVSLPIFQGGRLRAGLRGAQADRDAAVAVYDQTLTQALREVADVAASQRALTERLAQSREALTAAEDAHRIARLRYDGALANYQSVLLAEQAVLIARRVVADLESRAFTLDVALVRALGGGFTSS